MGNGIAQVCVQSGYDVALNDLSEDRIKAGFRAGPTLASADEWMLVVQGRQTHGARPRDGVDPITVGTQSMLARQVNIAATPVVPTASRFNVGVRLNIIPDRATLVGTVAAA